MYAKGEKVKILYALDKNNIGKQSRVSKINSSGSAGNMYKLEGVECWHWEDNLEKVDE